MAYNKPQFMVSLFEIEDVITTSNITKPNIPKLPETTEPTTLPRLKPKPLVK